MTSKQSLLQNDDSYDGGDPFRSNPQRKVSNVSVYSHNKAEPEDVQKRLQFRIYSYWNIIRFATVAIVICYSNYHNQNQIEKYRPDCCKCYYISENPQLYGIRKGYRIDWSYCMPQCVDCNYCIDHYNNTASKAFNDMSLACPAHNYHKTKQKVSWDWYKESGCPHGVLSVTSLQFFLKDYRVYAISTIIIVFCYICFMISLNHCCKTSVTLDWGPAVFVYNVIVSINAVYAMFKPMQYYHESFHSNGANGAICEVDTIDTHWEKIISFCVNASLIFIALQWIIGLLLTCITKNQIANPSGAGSTYKWKNAHLLFEKVMITIASILAIVFYLSLIYASIQMISKRAEEDGRLRQDVGKIVVIIVIDLLCISSCCDIFCCPFCRHTCSNYCHRRPKNKNNEIQTWRSIAGSSPKGDNNNNNNINASYSLQDIGNQ